MAFNITASPLSCQCGAVTITADEIPSPRDSWGVFLFYVATVDTSQNYSDAIVGNDSNPLTDTYWNVTLPMNASYKFFAFAVFIYDSEVSYGLGDWVYNPTDKTIYVSKAGSNIDNSLSSLVWWRPFDCSDCSTTSGTGNGKVNISEDTLETTYLVQNVTCNTSFLGLDVKMRYSSATSVQTLAINDKTGKFDFSCNPNGYGGLNPSRGDYAQFQALTNTRSDGTVYTFYARDYSYRSALKYNFDIPRDGLYVLNTIFVELHSDIKYYNLGDCVFDDTTNIFYKSLANTNNGSISNPTYWTAISTLEEIQATNYYKLCLSYFIQDANGRKLLYDLRDGIKSSCPCKGTSKCGDDLMKKWMFVNMCIEDACFAMSLMKYSEAQCFLERIPKNCSPYISIYKC